MSLISAERPIHDFSDQMPIYDPDYIWNEIAALEKGISAEETIFHRFDQLHYLGTAAVDHAIHYLKASPKTHILDIGSGLGGPARYLASRTGARVTGIELQTHLCSTSYLLTRKSGLSGKVDFVPGDFTQLDFRGERFDGWMSFLAFLHIENKKALFSACSKVLLPGGKFYIEDYYLRKPLTEIERTLLTQRVSCADLLSRDQYLEGLSEAGLIVTQFEDLSLQWQSFVLERFDEFQKQYSQKSRIHGPKSANQLSEFYRLIGELFAGGNLGGCRIHGLIR